LHHYAAECHRIINAQRHARVALEVNVLLALARGRDLEGLPVPEKPHRGEVGWSVLAVDPQHGVAPPCEEARDLVWGQRHTLPVPSSIAPESNPANVAHSARAPALTGAGVSTIRGPRR